MATTTPQAMPRARKAQERHAAPDMDTPAPAPAVVPALVPHAARAAPSLAGGKAPARTYKKRKPQGLQVESVFHTENRSRHDMPEHERAVVDAALAILGRYLREPGALLDSPGLFKQLARLHLAAETREFFAVAFLDNQHRLLAFEKMFSGTLTQTSVYPREVAAAALRHGAASVALVHNHPSASTTPSLADKSLTQSLRATLALVDVRILDHVIVAGACAVSFAEHGLL